MSLFSRFGESVDTFFEKRARTNSSSSDWARDVEAPTGPTSSGIDVGPTEARGLVAVWACQSLIADGVSSLPTGVVKNDGKGASKPVDQLPPWLKKPNPFDTPYTFWHKVMISLLGENGNAYILVGRQGGRVVSLWVLDPMRCDVDENSTTPIILYDGVPYGPDDIIHIPAFAVPYQRKGISLIDNAREAIGLGLAAEQFGARFFGQGATFSGIIEHPGKATPGEVAVITKMMKKRHGGVANSHAIGMLTGGATFKPISVNPDQAQFLETRRFNAVQIATLYRVPPYLIDPSVSSTWGTGIEEMNNQFVQHTLMPWMTKLEQAFSRLLPGNQQLKFNVDARLRAKTIERYQSYVMAVNNGLMTLDEVRSLEDLDPIEGGKGSKHYVPANVVELGKEPPEVPDGGLPINGQSAAAQSGKPDTNEKKPEEKST